MRSKVRLKLIMWEKSHGYKSRYVAEKVGCSPSTWSKIKLGKQDPTFAQIESFCKAFVIENVFDLLSTED